MSKMEIFGAAGIFFTGFLSGFIMGGITLVALLLIFF